MSDPFDLDDDEDQDQADPKANAAFAKQRKELREAQKQLAELQAFKAEREQTDRENSIGKVFSDLNLNPTHAKLFAAVNPEGAPTQEAVAKFATDYGLVTQAGEAPEPKPAPPTGYTPTVLAEGAPFGSKVYGNDEFGELMKTNPNEAFRLYQAGKVRLDKLSDIGGESIHRV